MFHQKPTLRFKAFQWNLPADRCPEVIYRANRHRKISRHKKKQRMQTNKQFCKFTSSLPKLPKQLQHHKKKHFFSNPATRAPRKQEKRNLTLKQHLVNGVGLLLLPGCCWDSGDSLFFLFAQVNAMGKWVG